MKKGKINSRLNEIASKESSKWIEKAAFRDENKDWLDKSAKIAIKILRELRAKKMSQVELAEKLDVTPQYINKVVKGKENLSLETISKIENALGITLISVPSFDSSLDYILSDLFNIPKLGRNIAKSIGSEVKKYSDYSYYQIEEETPAA